MSKNKKDDNKDSRPFGKGRSHEEREEETSGFTAEESAEIRRRAEEIEKGKK